MGKRRLVEPNECVRPKDGQPVWREQGRHADEELAAMAEEVADIIEKANIEAIKNQEGFIAEDGQFIPNEQALAPPLEIFNPNLIEALDEPSGAISLRDKFYIEREDDTSLRQQVIKKRSITTIRAPRQTGKSSLLARGLHYARQHGAKVIRLDLQEFDELDLESSNAFLRALAEELADETDLDSTHINRAWEKPSTPKRKLTRFMQNHILPAIDSSLVLAIDEADRLLQTNFYADFFGLIRAWYNKGAADALWEKLSMVLAISTEPHLFIDDIRQSPFNVGLRLTLKDFNLEQVHDLNQRYGHPTQEIPAVMKLLNGHPYLTRKAFYTMVTQQLSWADLANRVIADDGPFADHLSYQYRLLLNRPDLIDTLEHIIRADHSLDEKLLYHLSRAGLVKGSGDTYTLRCGLYKLYFEHKLGK